MSIEEWITHESGHILCASHFGMSYMTLYWPDVDNNFLGGGLVRSDTFILAPWPSAVSSAGGIAAQHLMFGRAPKWDESELLTADERLAIESWKSSDQEWSREKWMKACFAEAVEIVSQNRTKLGSVIEWISGKCPPSLSCSDYIDYGEFEDLNSLLDTQL